MFKTSFCLIFLIIVWMFSACSSSQSDFQNTIAENQPIVSPTKTPRIPDDSPNIADQNFLKKWRESYNSTLTEIERNHQLWQANKITNYDFVIEKTAGGMTNEWNRMPVLIKIREGKKLSIEKVEEDKGTIYYLKTDGFEDFDTVDKLFDYLRLELDDRNIIEIEYDKKFSYPKKITIIYTFQYNHNWHNINISKFEIIK